MRTYIAKRFVLFIPTLLIVTVVVFSILRVIPGDPALLILSGEEGDDSFTEEQLQALNKRRSDLVRMVTKEKNRLQHPAQKYCQEAIKAHILFMEDEIKALENEMSTIIKQNNIWEAKKVIMSSVP